MEWVPVCPRQAAVIPPSRSARLDQNRVQEAGMHSHRFGALEVRLPERAVYRDGQRVALGSRAVDVLLALIERRPGIVTKPELLDTVWAGRG